MTNERALELLKIERECIQRSYKCDRKCEKCPLVQESDELFKMYTYVISKLGGVS